MQINAINVLLFRYISLITFKILHYNHVSYILLLTIEKMIGSYQVPLRYAIDRVSWVLCLIEGNVSITSCKWFLFFFVLRVDCSMHRTVFLLLILFWSIIWILTLHSSQRRRQQEKWRKKRGKRNIKCILNTAKYEIDVN